MTSPNKRVIWNDGLCLLPNHFQQQERWMENLLRQHVVSTKAYSTGFFKLEINREALRAGQFLLDSAQGVLSDGTFINAPDDCGLPELLNLEKKDKGLSIYLTVASPHWNSCHIDPARGADRYHEELLEVRNVFDADSDAEAMAVASPKLKLLVDRQPPPGCSALEVARIKSVSEQGGIDLDSEFSPCFLVVSESSFISQRVGKVAELLHKRISEINAHRNSSLKSSSELGIFLLAMVCSSSYLRLKHLQSNSRCHPEELFQLLIGLLGELCCFSEHSSIDLNCPYDHLDQYRSFETVCSLIESILLSAFQKRAIQIPLEDKAYGIKLGFLRDTSLHDNARFILCARADIPAVQLQKLILSTLKIGAVDHIRELVNLNLPGISLQVLSHPPRELPGYLDHSYFELEIKRNSQWPVICRSMALALHFAEQVEGFSLELWAIRLKEENRS